MTTPTGSHAIGHWQQLLVIRHARTDMSGTLCGQSDPPLNALGREEAKALAQVLRDWNVRRLYASDLQRAVQTAQPLAELWDVPIESRTAFREISFGDWEGRDWSEISAGVPDIRAMESSPAFCAPGGETFGSFRKRVLKALKETAKESSGQVTAIVTHLGVIRVTLEALSSAECAWNPRERIDPCSIYRIQADGMFQKLLQV